MAISEVITFDGSPDLLVWKSPCENFNTTSKLIVPPTHDALLVQSGTAADLFGEGEHVLTTANLPFLRKLIEIPTGGKAAFPCSVYYVNKVHQMDLLWGTKDAFPLEDPLYEIFLHVQIHGSLSFSVNDPRRFLLKLCGLRDSFSPQMLTPLFRGIVAKHVKDCIAKIMINGQLSYFMISAHLMEISDVLQERLNEIFDDYGITLEFFNVETISVPKEDYDSVSAAKERRTSRMIEGYTWQEERQMMIAEKFASNEGTMGAMGGMMGGMAGGMMMGSSIGEIAKNAMNAVGNNGSARPGAAPTGPASMGVYSNRNTAQAFDVNSFIKNGGKGVDHSGMNQGMNQGMNGYDPNGMNQGMNGYGQPGMNQNMGGFGQSGMNQNMGGFGQPGMNQNMGGFGQPGMNQNMGGFGQPGMNQGMGGFGQNGMMSDPFAEAPEIPQAAPVPTPAPAPAPAAGGDAKAERMARLKELKEMFEMDLIDEAEFKEMKAEILAQLKG